MPLPDRISRSPRSIAGTAVAVAVFALAWHHERTRARLVLLCIAACGLLLSTLAPRFWRPVEAVVDGLVRRVLSGLTYLLLGCVFICVFIPVRLVQRAMRRDPMDRAFEPGRASYWEPLEPGDGADAKASRFTRQF